MRTVWPLGGMTTRLVMRSRIGWAYGLGRQGPATITKYRIFCGKHIIPLLGARKLRELTAREVDAWLFELSKSLSTATLQRVRSCLNRAVKRAMARDLVKRNVVELTEVPTGRAGRRSKSLTPKQVDDVLTNTATDRLHTYIVVSLLTGGRTEELRALRWEHVHLEADGSLPPHVEVWRSVRVGGDTKTMRSRRTLALPERCIEALCRQRAQQAADRLSAGERWRETGLVFTTKGRGGRKGGRRRKVATFRCRRASGADLATGRTQRHNGHRIGVPAPAAAGDSDRCDRYGPAVQREP